MHNASPAYLPFTLIILVALILIIPFILAKKKGYDLGSDTIVECKKGHLFSTTWVPGVSLKAVRLGFYRFQFCPVGRHWTLVRPVNRQDLSEEQISKALSRKDNLLP